MITLSPHPRGTRLLAFLLLVLQTAAGGAISLAHASDPLTAPVHIEAQHGPGCVFLHDQLRCMLCHYAASTVAPEPVSRQAPLASRTERRPSVPDVAPASRTAQLTPQPRGPPVSRS